MAEKNFGHLLGKVIAVDFDGCLCESGLWPKIGSANRPIIEELIRLRNEGVKLILNTCRGGDLLDSAVRWCEAFGLRFDAVNENLQERIDAFGGDSRKISADEYWDDRAVPVRFAEAEGKAGSETAPKPEEMTNEEAAKCIIDFIEHFDELGFYDYYKDALFTALTALRGWVRTADRLPTGADAGVFGNVVTTYFYKDECRAIPLRWQVVAENPEEHEYWHPLPPLPESIGSEGTKTSE